MIARSPPPATTTKVKRDNDYYLPRLRDEFPDIYRDLLAGIYKSPNDAFIAAGLRRKKSPIGNAKQAWRAMSTKELVEYIAWQNAEVAKRKIMVLPAAVDSSRRLTPVAGKAVSRAMAVRALTTGDVMKEMGLKALDASLGNALANDWRVSPAVAKHLPSWLAKNSGGSTGAIAPP